ncbi:MAG: PH domain-containing protein [Nocardioides sp.]
MAISPKLLSDGERVVLETRTHAKAMLLPLIALVVVLAAAVVITGMVPAGAATWAVWAIAIVGIIWLFVLPLLRWLTTTYALTNRRLITRSGVLTRRGHDIPLARVSDVAFEHGLIDRVLGCGTLIISDASTNGSVQLTDIPQVADAHRAINGLLDELHGRHDGT